MMCHIVDRYEMQGGCSACACEEPKQLGRSSNSDRIPMDERADSQLEISGHVVR